MPIPALALHAAYFSCHHLFHAKNEGKILVVFVKIGLSTEEDGEIGDLVY